MILYIVFHEEQIEKPWNNLFEFHGVNVCIKLMYYGNLPIYYVQLLDPETKKKTRCITNIKIAQHAHLMLYNRTLNPYFVYAFVVPISLLWLYTC